MSKFLLVAAYIASRNKPATDKRMFDMSGGRKGKRRRTGPMQADKQAEAAKAAALAGPSRCAWPSPPPSLPALTRSAAMLQL